MAQVRVQEAASYRLDEIYRYTRDRWGVEQADRYINGLFDAFEGIDAHEVASRRNRSLSGVLFQPAPARNNPSHIHQGGAGSDQGDSDQQQVAAA